jgi:putative CocE/NonD family hydrolase
MRVLRNILVPMSDSVHIAVDVYLPDVERKCPAVFYFVPYRKDDFYPQIGNGAGLPLPYTEHGFAFVLGDIRGTNDSEGVSRAMWDAREQEDGAEVVEWIASQSWCNGNVGMTGTSYGFFTSLLTAAKRPPHLKAIVPLYGSDSSYYCFYEGGLPMVFGYHADYLAIMIAMQGAPPGYRDGEGRWRELWRSRLENYAPWGLDWFEHQADDEFWAISSPREFYDQIAIPVFVIGGWGDRYPGDVIKVFENVKGPKKALIGPWHHIRPDMGIPGPRVDYEVVFRWFDYWLKGEQNGILDEPAFTLYTQSYTPPAEYIPVMPGYWRQESTWPIPGTNLKRLYLNSGESLVETLPAAQSSGRYPYDPTAGTCSRLTGGIYGGIGLPVDQRADEPKSLIFTTDLLQHEIEVTGIPHVRLHFSSTARVMDVIAKLCDVAPDGTVFLITRGQLNAAHREGLDHPQYLTPGTNYVLEFDMKATSYRFEPGHRIRLAVTSGEFQTILSTPERGTNTLYYGKGNSSYLELPLVPPSHQPEPVGLKFLAPPPDGAPRGASFSIGPESPGGEWSAIREAGTTFPGLEGTVEYRLKTSSRIHPERPAEAVVESETVLRFCYQSGEKIESRGRIHYRCDADRIYLLASSRVTQNDKEEYSRKWSRSYPRKFV